MAVLVRQQKLDDQDREYGTAGNRPLRCDCRCGAGGSGHRLPAQLRCRTASAPGLVGVLEDLSTPEHSIYLLCPATRALAPKVRAFFEYSLNEFGIADDSIQRDV